MTPATHTNPTDRLPPLRIALVGSARFGTAEPFAGGLEAHTITTARALQDLGHAVHVFAGPADRPAPRDVRVTPIVNRSPVVSHLDRRDTQMEPECAMRVARGYERILARIASSGAFDVVHNNSLHAVPLSFDTYWDVPTVHVLHCPPFDELVRAHRRRQRNTSAVPSPVISVSSTLHEQWNGISTDVIPNGVDTRRWVPGNIMVTPRQCVWAGRVVEEKGLHLAIDAARAAGYTIAAAGPRQHASYFDAVIRPRLGPDARWVGHLQHDELRELYASSAVGIVSPCWDEPFGLVAAEMLACGLPVAALDRGVVRSIVGDAGRIADRATPDSLAAAIRAADGIDRRLGRQRAIDTLSVDAMAERYVASYRTAIANRTARATTASADGHRPLAPSG